MQCKPEWAYKLEVVEYCINTSLASLLGGRKKLQEKLGVSRAIRRGTRQRPIESGVPFYSMSGGLCRCELVAIFHERTALPISHAMKPLSCPSLSRQCSASQSAHRGASVNMLSRCDRSVSK